MTDRFYPVGMPSEIDHWKTTYEVQNEMRSFARSSYPPGTAVHQPGAREKFGFSTPGPLAHRLAKPETALEEAVDIANPRAHHAMPRYQEPDDRKIFEALDMAEMAKSYSSPVAAMSISQGMGARSLRTRSSISSRSMPKLGGKTVGKLSEPNAMITNLEDDHFTYYVPTSLQRAGMEKLKNTTLSKLQKSYRITMAEGSGTGFKSQTSKTYWWPDHVKGPDNESTSYRDGFNAHPQRWSPMQEQDFQG